MILWSGQSVSLVGTQVTQIAFPLLILALTRSPALAGFVAGINVLPYLLLSLPAGAFVDRWNRKRTMILCDSARAILLASIPLALATGHLSIAQIYLVSLIEGSLNVFFSLSQTACLPQVVPKHQLGAASAQNEAAWQISAMFGPFFGGLLYGVGRLVPFVADSVSYAVSVVALLFIKTEFQEQRTASTRALGTEIWEGISWLWNQPLVRAIAFLSASGWIMLSAVNLTVIVLARNQHVRPATIGLIVGAAGVGGIFGSLLAARIQSFLRFGQIIIGSAWLWACIWPFYAVAPNALSLAAVTAALYFVWPIYNSTQMSYRLSLIPDHLQGRVNSAFRLVSFTGRPIGLALSGTLLQVASPRTTVLLLGIAPIAMALAATFNKHVRAAPPLIARASNHVPV